MRYILSLDQGTASCRAMLFDHAGSVVAQEQAEFAQIFPQPGWVEHDALEIWQSQLKVAKQCLKKISNLPSAQSIRAQKAINSVASSKPEILGIGITNQRETTALGAAYLAGLAVGFWSGVDEIASQWQIDRRFEPQMSADATAVKLARWRAGTRPWRGRRLGLPIDYKIDAIKLGAACACVYWARSVFNA